MGKNLQGYRYFSQNVLKSVPVSAVLSIEPLCIMICKNSKDWEMFSDKDFKAINWQIFISISKENDFCS